MEVVFWPHLFLKGISVLKPCLYFVVIHEIWKKNPNILSNLKITTIKCTVLKVRCLYSFYVWLTYSSIVLHTWCPTSKSKNKRKIIFVFTGSLHMVGNVGMGHFLNPIFSSSKTFTMTSSFLKLSGKVA